MEIDKNKIQKIIDKLLKNGAIAAMNNEAIDELKELINEKWEPKAYKPFWFVDGGSGITEFRASTEEARKYGNEWPTKELAETARDMNKRNQLILQAKHEMGYGDGRAKILYNYDRDCWEGRNGVYVSTPELAFKTREQAEVIIKMVGLNDASST
jgi:hypothetical protein